MYPVLDTTCQTKHLTCFQGHYPSSSLSFHSQFLGKTIRSQNSLFARKRFIVNRRWWRQFYVSNSTSAIVKLTILQPCIVKWTLKLPSKLSDDGMFHQSFCFIKDCHPSNVVFLQRSSSINVHLLSKGQFQLKVVFKLMSFCIKYQRPSSIHP